MGFFDVLGKLVKGEPVFQPAQPKGAKPQPEAPAAQAQPVSTGPKIVPQVYIGRVECNEPGGRMDVDITIQNYSQVPVEVDKVELFGRVLQLDKNLTPGQEHEFRVYSGSRPTSTADNVCRLYYKTVSTGDYFCANHTIEFRQEADRTYSINRIIFRPPVQDV